MNKETCVECGQPAPNHRWMCNRRYAERDAMFAGKPMGWICPLCGTVLSPAHDKCPCRDKGE